jgi:hypothetical protein
MAKTPINSELETRIKAAEVIEYLKELKKNHPNDESRNSTHLTPEEVLEIIKAAPVSNSIRKK